MNFFLPNGVMVKKKNVIYSPLTFLFSINLIFCMILNFEFVGLKFMTHSHAVNFHHKSRMAPWPNFRVNANEQVICSVTECGATLHPPCKPMPRGQPLL